jgi:hypothetical protein
MGVVILLVVIVLLCWKNQVAPHILWKKQENPPYEYGRYLEYLITTSACDNNNFSFNLNEN